MKKRPFTYYFRNRKLINVNRLTKLQEKISNFKLKKRLKNLEEKLSFQQLKKISQEDNIRGLKIGGMTYILFSEERIISLQEYKEYQEKINNYNQLAEQFNMQLADYETSFIEREKNLSEQRVSNQEEFAKKLLTSQKKN